MTKGPIVLTVPLALVAALAPAPLAVPAERVHRRPGDGGSIVTRPVAPRPMVPRPFGSRPFFPRPLFDRPFFPRSTPFGLYASPIVLYASPAVYGPPAYSDPPPVYGAPAAASVASPASYDPPLAPTLLSQILSVVEYPTGRYELRGDGITTPYRWVWIPNPPSSPPPDPQAVPQTGPPVSAPSTSGGQSSARRGQLYHWTDAQGVEHWTDRGEAVPDEYRSPAKPPRPS